MHKAALLVGQGQRLSCTVNHVRQKGELTAWCGDQNYVVAPPGALITMVYRHAAYHLLLSATAWTQELLGLS